MSGALRNKPHTTATVYHNYKPKSENEIGLTKGEVVKVYEKFENGWWVGETKEGKLGVFPGTYVREDKPGEENKPTTSQGSSASSAKRKPVCQATVRHDYEAKGDNELSLKKGTTINVLRKLQDDGWWHGEFEGRTGHFPASYVKEVTTSDPSDNDANAQNKAPAASTEPKQDSSPAPASAGAPRTLSSDCIAVALYDHNGNAGDELSFKKGALLAIDAAGDDPEWRFGKLLDGGAQGVFPSRFALLVPLEKVPEDESAPPVACALYNFQAVDPTELNLKKGDLVTVLAPDGPDAWWKGQLGGQTGHFPGNYVKVIPHRTKIRQRLPLPPPGQKQNSVPTPTPTPVPAPAPSEREPVHPEHSSSQSEEPKDVKMNEPVSEHEQSKEVSETKPEEETPAPVEEQKEAKESPSEDTTTEPAAPVKTENDADRAVTVTLAVEEITANEEIHANEEMSVSENSTNSSLPEKAPPSRSRGSGIRHSKKPSISSSSSRLISMGTCTALYEYEGTHEGMISFPSGAAITVYAKKPSGWWKGEYMGEIGYFPGSYVSEKSLKSKKKRPTFVRALYDFEGESDSELSFQRGDVFVQVDSPTDSTWARGTIRERNGYFPPDFVQPVDMNDAAGSRDSFKSAGSANDIEALRSMVMSLQQQVHTLKPGSKKGEEGHILRQLEESELIRQKQQEQLRSMGTRIESLVIQVNKQNDQISKQQKSIRKLSSSHKSSGSVSDTRRTPSVSASVGSLVDKNEEIERLREQLTIEVRQRCDLESIVRKLETQSEILSRQVTRLQRTFDEQMTAAELGPNRLRRTGRDLTH